MPKVKTERTETYKALLRSLYTGGSYQPYLGVKYTREIGDGPVPFQLNSLKQKEDDIKIIYETYKKDHPLIRSMRVLPKNFKVHVIYPDEIIVIDYI
jgi:hypothetical protein